MSDTTQAPEKKSSGFAKFITFLLILGVGYLGYNHFYPSTTKDTAKADSTKTIVVKVDTAKATVKADTAKVKAAVAATGTTGSTGKSTK